MQIAPVFVSGAGALAEIFPERKERDPRVKVRLRDLPGVARRALNRGASFSVFQLQGGVQWINFLSG
jgi:hypothetical protein